MVRRGLLQAFYYYTLLASTGVFFLFISTLSNLFDGQTSWRQPWFDENNQVNGEVWGGLLLYQLLALFVIIVFRRRQLQAGLGLFIFLSVIFFLFFMVPSLFLFIEELGMMNNA